MSDSSTLDGDFNVLTVVAPDLVTDVSSNVGNADSVIVNERMTSVDVAPEFVAPQSDFSFFMGDNSPPAGW